MLDIGINEFAWQWSRVKPGDEPRDNVMVMAVHKMYTEVAPFVYEYPRCKVETTPAGIEVHVYRGKDNKFAATHRFKHENAAVFTCAPVTPDGNAFCPAILCGSKTENFIGALKGERHE